MKFLKNLAIISCLVSPAAVIAQGYDVEGTDYYKAKASTQIWVEDASNLYIEMAKAFSCIIADSRTDATPNGVWKTLIDETKCGLGDSGTKSVVLGSGINESSRASNETPQEGSIWFTSADGNKFVVSVALHESAEDFAPYGRWNFAYYMYSTPGIPGETFTAEKSPATGFVLVSKDTDTNNPGGIVIESFDRNDEGDGELDSVRGKFIFSADLTTAKFIGRDQSNDNNGDPYDEGQAGRTNEDYYFQVSADFVDTDGDGEGDEIDETSVKDACFARNSSWKTGYQAALYDYTTGEEIPFTGAFNFTTTVDETSSRGYFSQWGIWLDNDDFYPDPSSPTLQIVDNSNDVFDLIWTSGELFDINRASVLTSSDYLNAKDHTKFVCTPSDTNECLLGTGTSTDAPFTYNAVKTDAIEDSENDNELYILSNADHAEPLNLYHDANRNGEIDSGENPIRFDFFVEWDNDAKVEKYYSYSSETNGEREYDFNMDREMSLTDSEGNVFTWNPNYHRWNHNYVAINEDDNKYEISPSLYLQKDYDFLNDDVNGARSRQDEDWVLSFDSPSENPGRYHLKEVGDCLASEDHGYICEIDLDKLAYNFSGDPDNTNTVFEFNGQSLHSQYYGGVETNLGWISVLNPKNGTVLTDINDADKKYVVLNSEMGDFLDRLDEGDQQACDDAKLSFESLAELGLGLSDIPNEDDLEKALPQFSWSDQPAVTSDTCEVVIGKLGEGC